MLSIFSKKDTTHESDIQKDQRKRQKMLNIVYFSLAFLLFNLIMYLLIRF